MTDKSYNLAIEFLRSKTGTYITLGIVLILVGFLFKRWFGGWVDKIIDRVPRAKGTTQMTLV